ncbi:hypothetical protein [Tissierella praeacuta]|nr:hypothetical protein [Tissierella praeacuta]
MIGDNTFVTRKNKKGKTSEIEGIFLYENNYNRRDEILLKGS